MTQAEYRQNAIKLRALKDMFYGYQGAVICIPDADNQTISCRIIGVYRDYILCEHTTASGYKYKICIDKFEAYKLDQSGKLHIRRY